MNYTAVTDPSWVDSEKKRIECNVKFDDFPNAIPFTASPDDSTKWGPQIFEECRSGKWGEVSGYVAPPVEWGKLAKSQRQKLLNEANAITSDWRTELQLGLISDADKESLIAWVNYIKSLNYLNLSIIKDEAGLDSIDWPKKPSLNN